MVDFADCGRCGSTYMRYLVFVKDEFPAIADHVFNENEYGQVCPDCRREVADGHAITDTAHDTVKKGALRAMRLRGWVIAKRIRDGDFEAIKKLQDAALMTDYDD